MYVFGFQVVIEVWELMVCLINSLQYCYISICICLAAQLKASPYVAGCLPFSSICQKAGEHSSQKPGFVARQLGFENPSLLLSRYNCGQVMRLCALVNSFIKWR